MVLILNIQAATDTTSLPLSTASTERANMALHLLGLPHEVLHGIFVNTDPQGLARLCCCRALNDFIKNDRLLYKELYLKYFVSFPGA